MQGSAASSGLDIEILSDILSPFGLYKFIENSTKVSYALSSFIFDFSDDTQR
jgi:hypothetical protein